MATKKVVADHDFLIPEFKLTQVADINYEKLPIIRRSSDAVEVLSKYIAQKDLLTQISVNEFAFVLYLNKQNRVIGITNLSIGGLDSTLMDVRMVYSMAVKIGASSIIVAHNHPSQNLKPSDADIRMSKLISEGGKTLTIQVLDFLIITSSSGYYSFGDEGMMAKGGVFAEGGEMGSEVLKRFRHKHIPTLTYDVIDYTSNGYKGIQKDSKSLSAKERKEGKIAYYSKSEIKELFDEEMAKGGITEHGLKVGDTIISEIDENTIVVDNPASGRRTINISTGHPMAKGGRMGFKALSEKVASNYEGKSVPAKYRSEYGSSYDKEEAQTVGNKVAAKVYRLQQGK
jgi:DNA repair protein RadC